MLISTNKGILKVNVAKVGRLEMTQKQRKQKDAGLSALKWVIIGGSVLAGFFTGGATWANVAVAAVAAAATTGIDVAQGETNAGALAMNWIGVAVAVAGGAIKAISQASKLSKLDSLLASTPSMQFHSQYVPAFVRANDFIKENTTFLAKAFSGATNATKQKAIEMIALSSGTLQNSTMSSFIGDLLIKNITSVSSQLIDETIIGVKELAQLKNNLPKAMSSFVDELIISGTQLTRDQLASLLINISAGLTEQGLINAFDVLELGSKLLSSKTEFINATLKIKMAHVINHSIQKNYNDILRAKIIASKQATEIIAKSKYSIIKDAYHSGQKLTSKAAKGIGWLDPNTAARRVVNESFKHLNKAIKAYFKPLAKIVKGVHDAKKLFIESGGLAFDSEWIMGYKIIDTPTKSLKNNVVMISFYSESTKNKRPVFAYLSDQQLISWNNAESKGQWYLDNIALSRGGRSLGLNTMFSGGIGRSKFTKTMTSPAMQALLSFIPTKFIRDMIQISTTLTKNVELMRNGQYFDNWVPKFLNSAKNSVISRSINTLSSVIGGGIASSYLGDQVGKIIGNELNRFNQTVIVGGLRKKASGEKFFYNIGNRIASSGFSALKKYSGNSINKKDQYYSQALKTSRKIKTISRLPNAITGSTRKMVNISKNRNIL